MAAKDIGVGQLVGNPLLARVDDFGSWPGRFNLRQVFRFHRITEDDTQWTNSPWVT
jgi:hypothetical protein